MVKGSTIGIAAGVAGAIGIVAWLAYSRPGVVGLPEEAGKFTVLYAGSIDDKVSGRVHKFQFRKNGERLGNEDVLVFVETVFTKRKIIDTVFTTPDSSEVHELEVAPRVDEAVNVFLTRKRTGEKYWFQCIFNCGPGKAVGVR